MVHALMALAFDDWFSDVLLPQWHPRVINSGLTIIAFYLSILDLGREARVAASHGSSRSSAGRLSPLQSLAISAWPWLSVARHDVASSR